VLLKIQVFQDATLRHGIKIVLDVSKDHGAIFFKDKESKKNA
jgi:hypothetical protein